MEATVYNRTSCAPCGAFGEWRSEGSIARQRARHLACTLFALAALAAPARAELTHGAALADIYDTILAGRLDEAARGLDAACPPAPAEACDAMRVAILWWRISLNPDNREFDAAIEAAATAAIEAARQWTRREPERAEAWFYHAAAHAPLVQWRLLRGQRLTAVREASRVKSSLERALDLEPDLHDAHFGIGLYRYYAGIAPAALRLLRWLLWLPGGDREGGLRQMEEARQRGQLLRGEADYQLHFIYLWYENQHEGARALIEGLHARYPANPLFLERLAVIQRDDFDDLPASVSSWQALVRGAAEGNIAEARVAGVRGRLGLAETFDRMSRTDRAVDTLEALIASEPDDPPDARARAHLQLAAAYDRLGDRPRARDAYSAAQLYAPAGDPGDAIRNLAREGLREEPDLRLAEAYRLALDGRLALEQGDDDRALTLLARSIAAEPHDLVARYWYTQALEAAAQPQEAAEQLETIVDARPPAPPFILAAALADYAALIEADGDTARAIDLYRRALLVRGGAPDTQVAARAALERLAP